MNIDGSPNLIAVAYAKVQYPNKIVITDNFMKRTPENIKRDSRICLAVWTKDWDEGYKFQGLAKYYSKGKYYELVKKLKENEGYPAKGALVVLVNDITKLI